MCDVQPMFRYELPVVQFRTLHDFIVDLDAGTVLAVYYDLDNRPGFVEEWHTLVRALVSDEHPHIAAVAFRHVRLFDSAGRVAVGDAQRRHQDAQHDALLAVVRQRLTGVGIEEPRIRRGQLSIPYGAVLVYAKDPLPAKEFGGGRFRV